MKKRILTVLLAVCLVFALGTVSALADDAGVDCNEDNCSHVAEYGDKHYESLNAAFTAALEGDGGTITLLSDATLSTGVTINKDITLDGAGHEITGQASDASVNFTVNSGTFTIKNVTLKDFGSSAATDNGIAVIKVDSDKGNDVRVVVDNVDFTNYCRTAIDIRSGSFSISGCEMNPGAGSTGTNSRLTKGIQVGYGTGKVTGTIRDVTIENTASNYTDWDSAGIEVYYNATVTIEDCKISDVEIGVSVDNDYLAENVTGANVTLNNVDVTASQRAVRIYGQGSKEEDVTANVTIIRGSFKGSIAVVNGAGTEVMTVNNATVNGDVVNEGGKLGFVGGSITGNVNEDNVTFSGTNVNGETTTTEGAVLLSGVPYESLAAAVEAAENGNTIMLLGNITVDMTNVDPDSGAIIIDKKITLDGNGKTITAIGTKPSGSTHVILISADDVTVEDITIDVDGKATSGIQVYEAEDVELNDVTIKDSAGAAVIVNASEVTATKLVTSGSEWGGVNVDNGNNTSGNASFTLVSGTVESVYTENGETDQTATVTIKGGTVDEVYNHKEGTGDNTIVIENGYVGELYDESSGDKADITVKGGTFGESVDEYADSSLNYEVYLRGDYTYYKTAYEALNAAGATGTINYIRSTSKDLYDVTFIYSKSNKTTIEVPEDTKINLPRTSYDGKAVAEWKCNNGKTYEPGDSVTIDEDDMTFTAVLREGKYKITIDNDIKHGDVTTNVGYADEDDMVYIYVDPDTGYVLDTLKVTYGSRNQYSVKTTYVRAGVYKFTMPDAAVTISATFKYQSLPFTDVKSSQWFYDEVYYVYTNGMMEGDSATTFNPDGKMTRAMFWAVLGRIDGEEITGNNWANEARAWAMKEGVSDGTNPNAYVTREQMVTMLWRYAGEKNGSASLIRFTDANKVSDWAVEAMRWAIGNGIIDGMTSSTLAPQGNATRAQCAAIFMRYDQM